MKQGSEKSKDQDFETVERHFVDFCFLPPPSRLLSPEKYPWEERIVGGLPRITKEHFRCRGEPLHPIREGEIDCRGGKSHSLPFRDGEEEIYPILLALLNYLQEETGCRALITCGHRCPIHNAYADSGSLNETSKHMIGGEVDFYLEGMEERPEKVVELILAYYRDHPSCSFREFRRFEELEKTNVKIPPWYNKEIFVKLYGADEGRDLDNDHPHPYLSIQVRYDVMRGKGVTYTWKEGHQGYARGL